MASRAPTAGGARPAATAICPAAIAVSPTTRPVTLTTLQDRLKMFETILERLRTASPEERLRLLDEHFSKEATASSKPPRASNLNTRQQKESPRSEVSTEDEVTELLNETSVGEDGRICFYGRTSLYHLQPEQITLTRRPSGSEIVVETRPYGPATRKESIYSLAAPSPALSQQSELGSIINSQISQELVNELLDVYWCWPHHLHLVLCRKLFMRDLANSGPYVTVFLLNSVLAQAARFSDRPDASQLSEYFAKKALGCLAEEIDKGSSIPTLQGLLVLSARECASGRTSQGWLYSGMAFRMMRDLGIHIHPRSLSHLVGQFSDEELALRQQIFWSCYTWDKTMSLCLGRAPTIHDIMPVPSPDTWLDGEEAENELWKPKLFESSSSDVGVSQLSRTNSRFSAYCKLCIMIDDILDTLYSRPHAGQNNLSGYLDRTIEKLENWAKELPSHLYINADSRTVPCPPLHILLLNLLYHATIILLCRPYRPKTAKARTLATKAAEMIDGLMTLHVKRFGFRALTYLETYTVFVGATINILDLKESKGEKAETASARLAFNMEVLRNARSTPSTMRCVEIIQQLVRKNGSGQEGNADNEGYRSSSLNRNQHGAAPPQSMPTPPDSIVSGQAPQNPTSFDFHQVRSDDMSFLHSMNGSNLMDMPLQHDQMQLLSTLHPFASSNAIPNMQANNAGSAVETPLRWLPDNVRDDCSWMMMDMDFAGSFGDGTRSAMNP
ncbi:hypothetical protein T310_10066 [Rasamsonia emersonii CBS 393.64]|uniref:Xylanolytic transcriptional activator regulatory domain-containing protein n=1 Tax=Rasamsonia emersonii (strain ATCC 16479 / CBS 393.64 / IMI 116815) TaxID=1408163 RepID=A0A0F4YDQ6_RASE3|nr:hypothetical protein T310_10066 [Rasamsonia emersonii CBS 393.64]KKA16332.1 hypothetical protein T310_10066 [Rasamsonia emersonii CBS 393.64]